MSFGDISFKKKKEKGTKTREKDAEFCSTFHAELYDEFCLMNVNEFYYVKTALLVKNNCRRRQKLQSRFSRRHPAEVSIYLLE
jgi:hypothetical protein